MGKQTKRRKQAAEDRISRKDAVIRQNNEELQNLKEKYERLDIRKEDRKVIDEYIACKDSRAERMSEKLYEKGRKDMKRRIRIRKMIRRGTILISLVIVAVVQLNKNDKKWEKLDELLKLFSDVDTEKGTEEN